MLEDLFGLVAVPEIRFCLVFRCVAFLLFTLEVLPMDLRVRISRFKPSISLIAWLRSALSSAASLLKTLERSCMAFLVLLGLTGMASR